MSHPVSLSTQITKFLTLSELTTEKGCRGSIGTETGRRRLIPEADGRRGCEFWRFSEVRKTEKNYQTWTEFITFQRVTMRGLGWGISAVTKQALRPELPNYRNKLHAARKILCKRTWEFCSKLHVTLRPFPYWVEVLTDLDLLLESDQ